MAKLLDPKNVIPGTLKPGDVVVKQFAVHIVATHNGPPRFEVYEAPADALGCQYDDNGIPQGGRCTSILDQDGWQTLFYCLYGLEPAR